MKLHQLTKSEGSKRKHFRKGRGIGSGLGKTCGKGHKGQRARSGHMKLGFEGGQTPLYRRLPKFGFYHFKRQNYEIINIGFLNNFLNENDIVSFNFLKEKKIIKKDCFVKILGKGKLEKKIDVEKDNKIFISKKAKKKIEDKGGNIKEIKK